MKYCPEGLRITFRPKKQRGPPKSESFLVPKLKEGQTGVDWYAIVNKYIETVNKEVSPSEDEPLFWCGRILKDGSTKFVKQVLGIGQIRAVPRFLGTKLGLDFETILELKGHSMRSTAATHLADAGLGGPALKNKLNHSSDKTVQEYVRSSKTVQKTNANILANCGNEPVPKMPKLETNR